MVTTNSTNQNRAPVYRWFLGNKSSGNPQKVNSLVYKNYTLIEYEDGTKSYVSPEEKSRMILEEKLNSSKLSMEKEQTRGANKYSESESDSGYEIPMTKEKPKSFDDLNRRSETEIKRNSSLPFFGGEISPGDNGKINLPPYIVPLETSLTFPMTKQKLRDKKNKKKKNADAEDAEKNLEVLSLSDEVEGKNHFSFKDTFWKKSKKRSSDADESPEDAEVREISESRELKRFSVPSYKDMSDSKTEVNSKLQGMSKAIKFDLESKDKSDEENPEDPVVDRNSQLEEPVEIFPEGIRIKEDERTKRFSHGFSFPRFPEDTLKQRERKSKNKRLDPNPLKKMFGIRGMKKSEGEEDAFYPAYGMNSEGETQSEAIRGRYSDAALSQIQSDTESADHGSADKSSMSKLTSERQPKKLVSGLFGSFRKGKNKERMSDNDLGKNSLSFEIAVKEQPGDIGQTDVARSEGIVYAELDMGRSPNSVMRRDDEKTEYAEIIYPGTKPTVERPFEDVKRSRENLTSSRENLTEVDEAFSTMPDGKKEATV